MLKIPSSRTVRLGGMSLRSSDNSMCQIPAEDYEVDRAFRQCGKWIGSGAGGIPARHRIISRRLLPLDKLFEELLLLRPQTRVHLPGISLFGLFIVGCLNLWTTVRALRLAIGLLFAMAKRSRRDKRIHSLYPWLNSLELWFIRRIPKYCSSIAISSISFISGIWHSKFMSRKILLASAKFARPALSPQVQSNNCNLFQIAVKFYFHFHFWTELGGLVDPFSTHFRPLDYADEHVAVTPKCTSGCPKEECLANWVFRQS